MYEKTYLPTVPIASREDVERITANQRLAAAAPAFDRLAATLDHVAVGIDRFTTKAPLHESKQ